MSKKDPINELKTSSLDRRLSIAKASLTVGKRWATSSAKGFFQTKEQKKQTNQAFMKEQAQYLVGELGKLKGSVVKIGQMLALYGETILPKEIVEALHTLDAQTAELSWSSIYKAIYGELGEHINELEIDPVPIGTASLAQVHKATIKATGEQVVLKVQYPKIAGAIDSDLSLFKHLLKLTNIVPQTQALDDWFGEIQSLLHAEVDYQKEADTTEQFYAYLANDDRYVVPCIRRDYSTSRLLCMSFEQGIALTDPILHTLSQNRRNAIGQAAIEIVIKELFVWGQMQTDPNFGNYLIRIDDTGVDKLVLLDFGAVKSFDTPLITIAQNLIKAGYAQNKSAMMAAMTHHRFFDTMSDTVKSNMADVFLIASEPFANPDILKVVDHHHLDEKGRYRWATSDLYNRAVKHAKQSMQSREFNMPPKEMMFISRKFIGAYALLSSLDARTNANQLIKPYL